MMGLGLLLPIALIVGLAYALGWIPNRPSRSNFEHRPRKDALDILRRRYASGEIDRDQFERMSEDLRG